ncbi:MAG: hypothetical protein ACLRSW_05880 [Christensenellaceae bacterium]
MKKFLRKSSALRPSPFRKFPPQGAFRACPVLAAIVPVLLFPSSTISITSPN